MFAKMPIPLSQAATKRQLSLNIRNLPSGKSADECPKFVAFPAQRQRKRTRARGFAYEQAHDDGLGAGYHSHGSALGRCEGCGLR